MTHHHLPPGTVLKGGRYIIQESISAGGFGITYKAHHPTKVQGELGTLDANITVALKEFFYADACDRHPDGKTVLTTTTSKKVLVEKLRGRFLKEAQTVASLKHPNIVKVLEIFEENGTAYMVMQFVEGGDLLQRICQGIQEQESKQLMKQVLEALSFVHKNNTMHLDIKPANILCPPDGRAVLIDFGFAKHYDEGGSAHSSVLLAKSIGYTPPEQYASGNVAQFSPAMDIYAVGATLYHCLTGQPPVESILRSGTDMPAPHRLNPSVPEALSDVVMKAMSMRPAGRYQSAGEMLNALGGNEDTVVLPPSRPVVPPPSPEPVQSNPTPQSPPAGVLPPERPFLRRWWGIMLVAVLAGLAWWGRLAITDTNPSAKTFTETVNSIPFTMVYVEGGSFQMGDVMGDNEFDWEKPVHEVRLDGYYMGETEVTQAQWRAVMGNNPSEFKGCDQCPVERVSWEDVQEFLRKLNAMTGKQYRLPTEAEWEYAARERGRKVRFGNGKDIADPSEINFDGSADYKKPYSVVGVYRLKTMPVGSFRPNALGLYDMSGNVWEWCQDWFGTYPSTAQTNPKGPSSGTYRVLRGGSWLNNPQNVRVSYRRSYAPDGRGSGSGFRLCFSS